MNEVEAWARAILGPKCRDCYDPPEEGNTRCRKHLDRSKIYMRRVTAKRIASGVCYFCGKGKPPHGKTRCPECVEKDSNRHMARRKQRKKV